MEYLSTTVVVFWIFASLAYFATLAFIFLDKNAKEGFKWLWILLSIIIGPIILLPYWFLGRER